MRSEERPINIMIMTLLFIAQLCLLVLSPVTAAETATCTGSGDVHYHTLDGFSTIDVQGSCMHTVARTCCANSCPLGAIPPPGKPCTGGVLDEFHVMAQHIKASPTSGVSYVEYVVVELCGYTVVMKTVGNAAKYSIVCPRVTDNTGIFNNKLENQSPAATETFQCRIGMTPPAPAFTIASCPGPTCIKLTTTYGVVVLYSKYFVQVTVPSKYQNVMCGICGNYDLNPFNDLSTNDGEDVSAKCEPEPISQGSVGDYEIGNSWMVNNGHKAKCVARTARRKRSISTRALTPSDATCNGWIDDICALCPSSRRAPILAMCLNYIRFVEARCQYCKTRTCSCVAMTAQLKGMVQGRAKGCGTCDCGNCRALVNRGCLSGDAKNRAIRECLVDCNILQGEAARSCRGRRALVDIGLVPSKRACPSLNDAMKDNEEAVMSVMRANSDPRCPINRIAG